MSITSVIFDYGCVLSVPPVLGDFDPLRKSFGLEPAAFQDLYWRHRDAFDLDALDVSAYWQMLGREVGARFSAEQIRDLAELDSQIWARPNPVMVEWVRLLRVQGLKIGLISNLSRAFSAYLRRTAAWIKFFDYLCFSGEMGVGKPDAEIYQRCLEGLGASAPEALFIDDREVNIEGARRVGLNGILFVSVEQLQLDLENYGLRHSLVEAQANMVA